MYPWVAYNVRLPYYINKVREVHKAREWQRKSLSRQDDSLHNKAAVEFQKPEQT
jgi:hypothetical protein